MASEHWHRKNFQDFCYFPMVTIISIVVRYVRFDNWDFIGRCRRLFLRSHSEKHRSMVNQCMQDLEPAQYVIRVNYPIHMAIIANKLH